MQLRTLINIHDSVSWRATMPQGVFNEWLDTCKYNLEHRETTAEPLTGQQVTITGNVSLLYNIHTAQHHVYKEVWMYYKSGTGGCCCILYCNCMSASHFIAHFCFLSLCFCTHFMYVFYLLPFGVINDDRRWVDARVHTPVSEWVSSFFTAHQHNIGHAVPCY